jgi:serine/threonine-protein kinase
MTVHALPEFVALQRVVAGRYSLERELGRGGMGVVFLARDVALDRSVAIKLLPPALAAVPGLRDRFLREARTAAKLSHPNIVPIHLVEEQDDLVYFVMAYVNGESLGERIRRRGALPPSQVARIVQEVAWALGYSHNHGVVHRDIKPDNILMEQGSERAMVTDFGIARVVEADTATAKGELLGTVHYMSPEQATGEPVDGRSDLYSLGVTAFHALTGKLPFESENLPAIIHQHVTKPAPRVASVARRVPVRLAEAVDRCLEKDPGMRFRDAVELANAVDVDATARKQVPPEVRSLLRHLRETGVVVGAALFVSGYGALAFRAVIQEFGNSDEMMRIIVAAVLISGTLLSYPFRIISLTRRVIRCGYGLEDVRLALVEEARALAEEDVLEKPSKWVLGMWLFEDAELEKKRRERWIKRGPFITVGAVIYFIFLFIGIVVFQQPVDAGLSIFAVGLGVILSIGLILTGAGPTVEEGSPVRVLPITERLLIGRFGRLLFRIAGSGVMQKQTAAPRDQRTEAFLASAADGIFDRLPKEIRRQFQAVRSLVERLESGAKALRKREAALSRVIAEAAPDSAPRSGLTEGRRQAVRDLEAARKEAHDRLEETVTALETSASICCDSRRALARRTI